MKTTVSKHDFVDQFRLMDRLENFSYEARQMLFDYFVEYEESTCEEIEMDVIAVCCEYTESSVDEIIDDYKIDTSDIDIDNDDERRDLVHDYLSEKTSIVGITEGNTIVYAQF